MNVKSLVIPIILWLVALVVIYTGMRPYEGGDGRLEIWRIYDTMRYGWKIQSPDQNNASVVLFSIAPAIADKFNLSAPKVYRDVLPPFYALTPVLLYFLFKWVMSTSRAFLSAMFFIALPPTYQEIPNIAKSMVAEPLAVTSLLLATSGIRYQLRVPLNFITVILVVMSHYTVGVFLVGWMGVSALVKKNWLYVAVVCLVVIVAVGYFSIAGNGAVIKGIMGWNQNIDHHGDTVVTAIRGGEFKTYSSTDSVAKEVSTSSPLSERLMAQAGIDTPLSLPLEVPSWLMTFIIRLNIAVLFAGGIYWATHRKYLQGQKELGAIIASTAIVVILAMYIPYITRGLYLSRWFQLAGIPMCGLYGVATYWLPRRWSYPIAGVMLLMLLVFVR